MQAMTVGGATLHMAESGAPDGPALVFVNSLGTDFRVWDRVVARMPPSLRLIRYDKRGHGLSSPCGAEWGMGDHVADLAALLDGLGVRDAVVCGLSIGGQIAQGLAAERLDLVGAMILMDTAAKIGAPNIWEERIAGIEAGGIEAVADATMQRWFSRGFHAGRAAELALWRAMLTRTPQDGYIASARAIAHCDLKESTARLRLATLAIAGDEDGSTPPDLVRETAELIPGARFEIIRGAGHLPCVEKPDETAGLILAFLRATGRL